MRTTIEQPSEILRLLSGHPTIVDAVRIASTLTAATAEVIVFDGEHAMVVGSLGHLLLQPRPLLSAETALLDSGARHCDDASGSTAAITGPDGSTIGALTVGTDVTDVETLLALSRICSSLLGRPPGDEGRFELVLEELRDAVIVVDPNLNVTYANRALGIQIGRSPAEVTGMNIAHFLHPDDVHSAFDALVRLGSGAEQYRIVVRVLHGSGNYIRLEATGRDLSADPRVGGILLSLRNSEFESELESSLQRTRRLSNALVEQLHDGIIATDAVGSLVVVNQAAQFILGLPDDSAPAMLAIDSLEFLDADAMPVDRDRHPIRRTLRGERISNEPMSVIVDGHVREILVSGRAVVDDHDEAIGTAIAFHDVTEARRAQVELRDRAVKDQLTGLPNRRRLKERIDELLAAGRQGGSSPVSEILIDLDNFKVINDTHGHRVGDEVIRTAAARLASGRRPDDLLVRLGGDEFVVLSRGQTVDEVVEAAEQMRRQLMEPFDVDGHMFTLTCSIGVAHLQINDLEEDSLLRYADLALYAAKARGRNRVEVFDDALEEEANAAAEQRELLRRAIDEDSLVMHLQPLVDSVTDEIIGFESLARCRQADGTLIGPSSFITAASGSGLIWDLDRRAFELTCRATADIATHMPNVVVACNFSALSIVQPDFVESVIETMARCGVRPATICIEITESAAFEAGPAALVALRELNDVGVLLALDDFGTGYSSLSHLRDLPLATVKVDRSFIARIDDDSSERSIVEAVVKLAHGLGLGVVAEGVETSSQLDSARSIGFNVIQGWHYSPARELAEIMEMLEHSDGAHVPAEWSYQF